MKTVKVCSVIALCAVLFTGLSAGCSMGGSDTGGTQTPASQSNALEDALAASGDLSFSNADFTGLTATVSRTMVIKGASAAEPFDMKGSTLIITADGVTLRYLKNVNVIADEKLGEGSLNVTGSQLNTFTVKGGGSSSIYVNDTAVTKTEIQKAGVHVVFTLSSSDVTVGTIEITAPCNIESQAAAGRILTITAITVSSTDTVIHSTGEGNLALTSLDIGSTVFRHHRRRMHDNIAQGC